MARSDCPHSTQSASNCPLLKAKILSALQVSSDYHDLCKGREMVQKKNAISVSPARKVRVKSGRKDWESEESLHAPAAKKSKGVPGEAPGWLLWLECLLQSWLEARLIWLRRCHWWFLRGLECSPAKSESHLRSSKERERHARKPLCNSAECEWRPLAIEESICWPHWNVLWLSFWLGCSFIQWNKGFDSITEKKEMWESMVKGHAPRSQTFFLSPG